MGGFLQGLMGSAGAWPANVNSVSLVYPVTTTTNVTTTPGYTYTIIQQPVPNYSSLVNSVAWDIWPERTDGFGRKMAVAACPACRKRWKINQFHIVVTPKWDGFLSLCETCWTTLNRPQRLRWTRKIFLGQFLGDDQWKELAQAVWEGK